MKLFVASFLLVSLVLTSSFFELSAAGSPKNDEDSCHGKCTARCSKAEAKDQCLKHCKICCKKCHCVPSHKDDCPCYSHKNDSKGKPKCP
ncbi:PREDICTED: gibberellin-regulated protein 8-like [Tarenaya hassleriana]|uniref:gibberellin-regulated protein 8-like n=1 Tax=Tarenaya hassleriana TaxID=28532 RepID=UPI00053C4FF4|nr:PREDICTED: gibberellin-regulated protein 8-like [Tarenaya hassleriana]